MENNPILPAPVKVVCGAKTRSGRPCAMPPMAGKTRCRMHGGSSTGAPKGNKNSLRHGIYAAALTDEELELSESLRLGQVEDELRLCRIRLRRALLAESAANGQPELDSITEREGSGGAEANFAKTEKTSKVRDYNSIIERLLGRIESLEKTRIELGAGDDDQEFDADSLTTGSADEETPENPVR